MIDIKFLRENPEAVKENIRKKFQEQKLPLVDEVIALDAEVRAAQQEADEIRAKRNKISKEIGALMGQGKKEEAEAKKAEVAVGAARLSELEEKENDLREKIKKDMMTIPNIIDPSVPIGKDDTENVEIQKYGDPVVPDFEIPYHTEIMERFHGVDMDAAGRVAGNGFYYLMGDIARLHSAVIAYARDFMIGRGFTYCVPPFMIRSAVVDGVMSFADPPFQTEKKDTPHSYHLANKRNHSSSTDTCPPARGNIYFCPSPFPGESLPLQCIWDPESAVRRPLPC